MQDPLGILLRNAEIQLIDGFLDQLQAPSIKLPIPKQKRKTIVAKYTSRLIERDDGLLAKLQFEAGRVQDLASARYDRYFQKFSVLVNEDSVENLTERDRALWYFLNDRDAFESIEREVSYEHLSGTKTKHTQFDTKKDVEPDFSAATIEKFETEVRKIYRLHDGSGKHATSHPPTAGSSEPDVFLYSLDISQPPSQLVYYGEDGAQHDDTIRKITWLHIRYERKTGALYVVSSRGGFDIRLQVSEQFAQIVLNVSEPPTVRKVDRLKLGALLRSDLSPIPGQKDMTAKVVELALGNGRFPGAVVNVRNKEGIQPALLKTLFGNDAPANYLYSVKVRIEGFVPEGSAKASTIVATFDLDGSTSFDGNRNEQRLLRDTLPSLWGLRDESR